MHAWIQKVGFTAGLIVSIASSSNAMANIFEVASGIFRSGRPSAPDYQALAASGVQTIISLETYTFRPWQLERDREAAEANGFNFVHSPVSFIKPTYSEIQAAVNVMADPATGSSMVHCLQGQDRTGLVVAAYQMQEQGWSRYAAEANMYQYGYKPMLSRWTSVLDPFGT